MPTSLLTLLDDIASVLDDVSVLTKVATQKTAGVLGDDLALNAEQVAGVRADRELPVVWAVAKGSLLNKAVLVPSALAISAWAPWAVVPLLMLGGAYLCYEGGEKLAHKLWPGPAEHDERGRRVQAAGLCGDRVDRVQQRGDRALVGRLQDLLRTGVVAKAGQRSGGVGQIGRALAVEPGQRHHLAARRDVVAVKPEQ